MPWMDEDLTGPMQSGRSRDEILAGVLQRGRALQLRRRLMMAALTALAVILVLPAGVLAVRDDDSQKTQVAASAPTSTTVTVPPTVGGAAEPVSQPPLAAPAAAPPTASAAPTTTKAAPPPTARPAVVPTPVPAGPSIPACAPSYLEAIARTDRTVYQASEVISLSGSVRNSSSIPCTYGSYTFTARVRALDGREVWSVSAGTANEVGAPMAPGDVLLGAPSPWDRRGPGCGAGLCPPGRYTGLLTWSFDGGPAIEAGVSFLVEPPPPPPPPPDEED